MKLLQKILIINLIFLVLTMSIPVQAISAEVSNIITRIADNARASVTTIDLTGLVTGDPASHSCVYETKYNDTSHWQQCFICNKILNSSSHNLIVSGKYGCGAGYGYQKEYCSNGCGYSKTLPKQAHTEGAWRQDYSRQRHVTSCSVCSNQVSDGYCYDSSGTRLGCVTGRTGTCVVCGLRYTKIEHTYNLDNGQCRSCGKEVVTSTTTSRVTGLYTTEVTWKMKPTASNIVINMSGFTIGSWSGPVPYPTCRIVSKSKDNSTGEITVVGELKFSKQNAAQSEDSRCFGKLTMDGANYAFNLRGPRVYPDNIAPIPVSVTSQGNGTASNFSRKATITAIFKEEFDTYVQMALFDSDGTMLSNWEAATRNGTSFTKTFDVVTEALGAKTITVKAKDGCGNIGTTTVQVSYIDSKAPRLVSAKVYNTPWTKEKIVRFEAEDKGVGGVQLAFNKESDYQVASYENGKFVRTYRFIGDVYQDVIGALYLKDALGNVTMQKITIGKLDNTAPTITNVKENLSANRRTANLVVEANDISTRVNKSGSGISGYQMTNNNTPPTTFQASNTFTVTQNGTYYLWAKDLVGNISQPKAVEVVDVQIEIPVNITWNDNNNKYNSRVGTTIKLYRKISGGQEEFVMQQNITAGQTKYTFLTEPCDESGREYEFRIVQDEIPGYETIVAQRNITNNLILPNYTSELKIEPKDSFENRYLKNGQVKLEAIIQADSANRAEVGVHTGTVQLQVDSKINIDTTTIRILQNEVEKIYTITGNIITIPIEKTKAGDRLELYLEGTLNEIGTYNSSITYTGSLRDYRGANTNINLGVVSRSTKEMTAEYQLPEANIQFTKKDSITRENLTNAEFTLYEWNGEEYTEVEKIRDDNQDGIYASKIYRWNHITQGKYKLVETTIPQYHTNIEFGMEYNLNQLRTQNYTVTTDYSNGEYKIQYTPREPDEFKRQDGIVENEPWKAKIKINKVDLETGNIIQNKAEFVIYEWNKDTQVYEQSRVAIEQQEDKTYLSNNWIYYTSKNEGKFVIIETKAPFGYYGDYQTVSQKNIHYIDLVKWIESGEGENETTISLGNSKITNQKNEETQFTNTKVKASILAKLIDSETKEGPQGNATLEGAVYGLYAYEEIYHADGVTSRYDEPGLLYKNDELVQAQTSSKNGELVWKDLECGKYYIKMIQAPNGYLVDEKKYKVDLDYETEEKSNISQTGKIQLKVKKQAFELYKIKENAEDLANAGFSIYKISELSIVKEGKIVRKTIQRYELKDEEAKKDKSLTQKANEDGTYMLSDLIDYYYKIQRTEGENVIIPGDDIVYNTYNLGNEALAKDYSNYNADEDGRTQVVKIREIRTNEKGYMKSPKLAYGEYIIIETSVPREQDNVPPFIVQIMDDSDEPQTLKYVVDNNFRTKLKIYVKDAKTKETIINNNSAYVIRNAKTEKLETYTQEIDGKEITYGTKENPFIIGKDGFLQTPMKLEVGEYIIEQIIAPKGYVVTGKEQPIPRINVRVTVKSNSVYHVDKETGEYIIVVNQINEEAEGRIKITAQGEFLSNAQIKQEETNLEYSTSKIQGSQYELIAKEDIKTQDGHETVIYKKGDKVTNFTTKGEEEVILNNILQGQYEIKQTLHAQGFADKKVSDQIEIKYKNQETPVVEEKAIIEEQRQKVKITIYNKDGKTGKAIKGGVYGLYTLEEIPYINNKGQMQTIPANTLITKTEANIEGKIEISAEYNKDIPQGKYYVRELETPQGYIATLENIVIDATTTTGEVLILIRKDNIKEKTRIQIKNIDEKGNSITGSKIEITDGETVVATIDKVEEINTIEGLAIERKYIIKKTPITGFTTGEDIEFFINKEGKLEIAEEYKDKQEENTIVIKSEPTKLKIVTQDKQTKEKIEGIELEIKNEEGKTLTKLVEKEEKGTYYIQKLPIGTYKIIETKIPYENGYVEKQVIEIKVEDNENWQEVIIEQETSKVLIKIEDEETKEIVKSAQIVIRKKDTKEIVATTEKQEGKIQSNIRKIEETSQGYVVNRLAIGNYEIVEKVPDGYKQIGIEQLKVKDTKEWQNLIIQNRKLIFSMQIDKQVEEIRANGTKLKLPKKSELYKIEIRNKDVKTDKIEIQYKIQVKNTGEIDGSIGTIIDTIPNGLEYVETEKGIWEVSGSNLICNKYNDKILKPGEVQEVKITLKWKNSESNFGEKRNKASLKGSKNKYNYPNKAGSTNATTQIGESFASVIISLRTGIEYKITAIRIGLIIIGVVFVLAALIISEIKYLERKKKI